MSPFLSRLACQILSQTNKHGVTLIPAYTTTHLKWRQIISPRNQLLPEWHLLPQQAHAGPSRGGPACIFSFYSMPALLHLGNSTTSRGFGVECLQPSLDFSDKLCVSSSCSSSSGSVQVSGKTCQWSSQTFDSGGTMLMEAPWPPTIHNMLADVPPWCPNIKDLVMYVLVGQVLKGLQYLH